MRKTLALLTLVVSGIAAAPAAAAIEVAITSPQDGAHSLGGVVDVDVTASADSGIYAVRLNVDGQPYGDYVTAQTAPYRYRLQWPTNGVTVGPHTLSVTAMDWSQPFPNGTLQTSKPITVDVGPAYPTISLAAPPSWTFVHGTTQLKANVTSAVDPTTVQFALDGTPLATAPAWDTTISADGQHTLTATVADGRGKTATASATVTIDNTAPVGFWFSPTANQRVSGTVTLEAHASDTFGVGSVQFRVDGAPAGPAVTTPDAGALYVYSRSFDTSALAPGVHAVSATITDNAGNTTTLPSVSVETGPIQYLPVLNYHEINPPDGYSPWDQTPQEADQQLAWLKANGYQSVTLAQYQQWLAGNDVGVAKPVLITVDDGLRSELAWDALLAKYGFKAVLFVVTGYADNSTPGSIGDPNNMSWTDIKALAANGRWEIAFHAGRYGHGDYGDGTAIGTRRYQASCPYFYSCLGGTGSGSAWTAQTVASYQSAVSSEIDAGVLRLKQQVPSAQVDVWAAPFNDAGQWTNLYNDPSGQVQGWLPGYLASRFQIVFTQTNPITYGQASGTVGDLAGLNRRYRFEVRTDTTIAQFAQAVQDPAFAR